MKILAIRGKNLASLAGEFELDFCREPLASAGLYGITGPTGAGKSTLLDALCVALYEKTPRLDREASGTAIPDGSEGSVGSTDKRTLLRKGAGEGHAEVDFVGNDGIAYRSRWTVRRARGKSTGKLQNTEMSLSRLADGQVLGDHRKTETLRLIENLIGLSFDQFTRAVLLAQNDFAAFLKASDDDRAELLQTLTGTETFTRLSRQAFERNKLEQGRLAGLQNLLAGQAPLPGDERQRLASEGEAGEGSVKALEQGKAELEGQLRWHAEWQKRLDEERATGERLQQARAALDAASGRRQALERIEAVQPARPLRDEEIRLQGETAQAEAALKEAQERQEAAQAFAEEKRRELQEAGAGLERAEKAMAEARPALEQARDLDAKIQTLTPLVDAAVQARDEAVQALADVEAKHKKLEQKAAGVAKQRQEAEVWLAAHPDLRPLAEDWSRWDLLLGQAATHLAGQTKSQAEVSRLEAAGLEMRANLEKARADHAACEAANRAAGIALDEAQKGLAGFDAEAMARQRTELEARRDRLTGAAQLWQSLLEREERRAALAGQEKDLAAQLSALAEQLGDLAAKKLVAEQELASAERARQLAELAASENVANLRAGLEAGAPCPVCGSTEHPYAGENPVLDGVLEALRADERRARNGLREIEAKEAKARGLFEAGQSQREDAARASRELDRTLAGLRQRWSEHPMRDELAGVPEGEREAWLDVRQRETKAGLKSLAAREAGQREAARRRDEAQKAEVAARHALELARTGLERLEREQARAGQEKLAAAERLAEAVRRLAAAQESLDPAFPGTFWREEWREDPEAFTSRCRKLAGDWLRFREQLDRLSQECAQLETQWKASAEARGVAAKHRDERARHCAEQEAGLGKGKLARSALFEGRAVAAVEGELSGAVQRAADAQKRCRQAGQEAEAGVARQDEAAKQAVRRLQQARAGLDEARARLAGWLAEFGAGGRPPVSLEELASLLDWTSGQIQAERAEMQALAVAVKEAQAVRKESERRRIEHEASRPGPESVEVLSGNLAELVAELDEAKKALSAVQVALAQDDAKRRASASLREKIEAQQAVVEVWARLSDLIGSHDGKKFRNFAQQLTLDVLLGYANRHLETLARRYRLERVTDTLGLLVVDKDMGDEVRSVNSLSGGESFLVSLALALGLASLSSYRVRVESLFIDEGFGSLDADSLAVAMEALDRLQAQGRKVGMISHVAEMNDRLGTRVIVKKENGGRSRVEVEG